jgi:hypothetical protein
VEATPRNRAPAKSLEFSMSLLRRNESDNTERRRDRNGYRSGVEPGEDDCTNAAHGFPRVRRIGHPTLTSSWLSASTLMAISIDTHGYQHRQVFLGQNLQIGDATLNSRDSFLLRILDCPSCQRLAGLSEFSAIRPARPRALSPARPSARRTSARGMPARRAPARLSCNYS